MDYANFTDNELLEIIEKKYGNDLKKWDCDDPAVFEFMTRISMGED